MNWKSTSTAVVSGAGLLATWLGWVPASYPVNTVPGTAQDRTAAASDIQAEAQRLQVRVRKELDYRDPTRNPFRFGTRPAPSVRPQPQAEPEVSTAAATPLIQSLGFALSGMATETVDGTVQRTAILSTASNVLFVKEGDRVDSFTVTRIDEAGVEMMDADGSVRRLVLTP